MEIDKVVKEYNRAKAVLLTVSPFIASLLNKARVIVTPAIKTAGVDTANNIAINPEFFMSLNSGERVFVLAHEVLHWAFLDPSRVGERNKELWNFVTDAVNNTMLMEFLNPGRLFDGMITLATIDTIIGIGHHNLSKMTKEEIYKLLENELSSFGQGGGSGGNSESECHDGSSGNSGSKSSEIKQGSEHSLGGDLKDKPISGHVIQEGSRDIYSSNNQDELGEAMKRAIAEAEQMQKIRGNMPAGLQRAINNILRPKVPWKVVLRQYLKDGLGRISTQSWKKLSRRHKDYPGNKRLVTPTVWVGIDTSGSIGRQELEQFISEVYGIAKQLKARIIVVPWDAEVYEPIKVNSVKDVRYISRHLRGGGGTDPKPFLELTYKKMGRLDAVVILSDGYIGSPDYYTSSATKVIKKASVGVFVSTGMEVRWPGWKFIKLDY